ncbi:hypothetical protein ACWDUL_17535 [Nocardia niigatensis]
MSYPHNQSGRSVYHPYPEPPRRPESGAAGIIGAAMALLFGLLAGLGSVLACWTWSSFSADIRQSMGIQSWMVCGPIAALLLIPGGLLLLRRRTIGRVLVIIGTLPLFAANLWEWRANPYAGPGALAYAMVFSVIHLGIVILVALPSTGRWIRTRPL